VFGASQIESGQKVDKDLFRHKVFKMLLREKKISRELVGKLQLETRVCRGRSFTYLEGVKKALVLLHPKGLWNRPACHTK